MSSEPTTDEFLGVQMRLVWPMEGEGEEQSTDWHPILLFMRKVGGEEIWTNEDDLFFATSYSGPFIFELRVNGEEDVLSQIADKDSVAGLSVLIPRWALEIEKRQEGEE